MPEDHFGSMFASSGRGGEFGGVSTDPGRGFAIGAAAAPRVCGWVLSLGAGAWRRRGDCRWYCLIARGFAISGGCMAVLHSDI
ncbi:MAG: hypothetical protein KAU52_03365 [Methanosarcinales archaeon]|nr:hypothetical protein [Methanosarcinales archaeon]